MRWILILSGSLVLIHLLLGEVRHLLEGIHGDQHRPDVRLKARKVRLGCSPRCSAFVVFVRKLDAFLNLSPRLLQTFMFRSASNLGN